MRAATGKAKREPARAWSAPFYNRAAWLLDDLDAQAGSLRSLATRHQANGDAKRLLALCMQALRYRPTLEHMISKTGLLEEKALAPRKGSTGPSAASLALCLVHDALFAKRGVALAKDHTLHKAIARHLPALRAEKARELVRRGLSKDEDLQIALPAHLAPDKARAVDDGDELSAVRVRWLRINTLAWTVETALGWLRASGYTQVSSLDQLDSSRLVFVIDEHLPMLLALAPSFDLSTCQPYRDGRLIAQDKASCFPAAILAAGVRSSVSAIDATAAPGNKTTMLAALLTPHGGSVVAFERDPERFKTLKRMLDMARAKSVRHVLGDFMAIDSADPSYADVTHLLVDPSCSGSGIVSRMDALTSAGNATDHARLKSLSGFQTAILSHAMRFTSARRIVYSTCSVHEEENERVVERVLRKPEFAEWSVAPRFGVLPTWPHRGVDGYAFSGDVIRCAPERDSCNGFFVACLVRGELDAPEAAPSSSPSPAPASAPLSRGPRRRPVREGRWRITLHDA